jgi:hypothetical protein
MDFRIANTFSDSLDRLTGDEQKAVKMTAFDLQLNPTHPSMQFHRIERAKDPNFWSVRVSRDLRIIVHKTGSSLLLCYVDHHDDAYAWAAARKLERHPVTGAAQLVEIRERIEEIPIYRNVVVDGPAANPAPLFAHLADDELLRYGVPLAWLAEVRVTTEDTIFDIAEHLPQEAAEALLELATGGKPVTLPPLHVESDPFDHPDAQRRFRMLANVEELERALEYPWEKWTVFLHPMQRKYVEREYSGPARIAGSAGTGKTIVALHRAVFLARRHPEARILLATFSEALANALNRRLLRLIGNEPQVRERILLHSTDELGMDLYGDCFGPPNLAANEMVWALLAEIMQEEGKGQATMSRFTLQFLFTEWNEVVDAWQLTTWEAYRDVPRLGRKTRIGGNQRERLWRIFLTLRERLAQRQLITWPMLFARLADHYRHSAQRPFDFAVVDECQDLSISTLRFLSALGAQPLPSQACPRKGQAGGTADSLFFTGDLGQRIFQTPFSWEALGVNVRGRSHILTINYRTSHQIRYQADRLLPGSLADVDGNEESRRGTISVFNGPPPEIKVFEDGDAEKQLVGQWIAARLADGLHRQEIGVFVRSEAQLPRAVAAIQAAGAQAGELDKQIVQEEDTIATGIMHLAKGLEFRAVVVMACDDEVIPLQDRIEEVTDESDLEEVYDTERHLLYVACTRAREHLLVTGVAPASEFLDDLEM